MNTHSGESFALIASCRHFGGSQGGRNSWVAVVCVVAVITEEVDFRYILFSFFI